FHPTYRLTPLPAFIYKYASHRDIHSFPTRRSSDLFVVAIAVNVRGVQKRDAQLNRTMNRSRRFRIVPRSIKFGHPHTAQTQGGKDRKSTRLNSSTFRSRMPSSA